MWQKIFTTFFLGQVALETAAEASKKQLDSARAKASSYKERAEEYKSTQLVGRAEQYAKEKFAHLRSSYAPFEATCSNVAKFLGETAEIKTKISAETNA